MVIADSPSGVPFKIVKVTLGREIGKRLADMGFTEGAEGIVVRGGFMHGPMQVRIRGYDILIRRSEAAAIEVKLEGGGSMAMEPVRGPHGAGGRGRMNGRRPGRGGSA
jgi:Fe2+ transport system protein FeoA